MGGSNGIGRTLKHLLHLATTDRFFAEIISKSFVIAGNVTFSNRDANEPYECVQLKKNGTNLWKT
jgi:hypothetical protein